MKYVTYQNKRRGMIDLNYIFTLLVNEKGKLGKSIMLFKKQESLHLNIKIAGAVFVY